MTTRILVTLLLALLLTTRVRTYYGNILLQRLESVQALQVGNALLCTTFSINARQGYWATAGHCAVYEAYVSATLKRLPTIGGQPARVIYVDNVIDLAIYQSARREPALPQSPAVPKVCSLATCELFTLIGFPGGEPRTMNHARLLRRHIRIGHDTYGIQVSDLLHVLVVGGQSGSPVLNEKGQVVGVLWGGFASTPLSVMVPLEYLRTGLRPYWRS